MIRLELQIEFKEPQIILEAQVWLVNLHISLGWRWLTQLESSRKRMSLMAALGPFGLIAWLDRPSAS